MRVEERRAIVANEVARRAAVERDRTDLGAFIVRRSKDFVRPDHLSKVLDLFDRIEKGEQVFALVEAPPRHAKSETIFHGIARAFEYRAPRVAYATYSNHFAFRKSRRIRDLVAADGQAFKTRSSDMGNRTAFNQSTAVSFWSTNRGGMFMAGGRGGGFKGEGFDLICLDDPYKNRAEYESPVVREAVWELWTGTLRDRVEPNGSVIIFHQRWGPDDLIGRLKELQPNRWEVVTLPAISEDNEPLWEERYDLKALEQIKDDVGDYNWFSQFQQQPRPRGEVVFGEPSFYTDLPASGYRVGFGIDLAYSKETKSDFSVILRGIAVGRDLYITDMVRVRETILGTTPRIKALSAKDPTASWRWYTGGQERAIVANLRKDTNARIRGIPAKADKFVRALPAAAAWNQGRIMLPRNAPWTRALVSEVTTFTGTGADTHDDIVDALAALHDELLKMSAMVSALSA